MEKSKELTEVEKKEIQRIFDQIAAEEKRKFKCSFLKINNLARAAAAIVENEAFSCLNSQMVSRSEMLYRKRMLLEKLSGKEAIRYYLFLQATNPRQV